MAIQNQFPLGDIPVSGDLLTAGPGPVQRDPHRPNTAIPTPEGEKDGTKEHYPMTLEAVKDMGYQIIQWDGRYAFVSELRSSNLNEPEKATQSP